jgi:RNA polymerase sigma factor for flagellar operon FliA
MNDSVTSLMASYLGLVRALAWKIHQQLPRSVDLDDLVGYGCVGLAEAARAFDQDRGLKFSTYAFHRIRGAILDGLSQMSWFREDKFEARAYQDMDAIPAEPGRPEDGKSDPKDAGVVQSTERALRANAAWFRRAADRLDQAFTARGAVSDEPVDRGGSAESIAMQRELEGRLGKLVEALPAAAAELLKATYYEGLTLKDAAARMGRNKSWASRLHARTLRKLATSLKAEGYA